MNKAWEDRFIEQIDYIGNQIKTLIFWRHILKKYILGNDHDEVFNSHSPNFAWAFQQLIVRDLFMIMAKLADPPKSRKDLNISFLGARRALLCSGLQTGVELRKLIFSISKGY